MKRFVSLVVLTGLLMPAGTFAAPDARRESIDDTCKAIGTGQERPLSTGRCIKAICTAIEVGVEYPDVDARYLYTYQVWLADAANVTDADSDEDANSKISAFIVTNISALTCDHHNFNVRPGNLFKLGVARNNSNFIDDALHVWRVLPAINHVDTADGRTVLDYIADEKAKASGTSFERTLDRYYREFKAIGAKHVEDLL